MMKPTDDVTQFHSVDQTTNPQFFTQFMDTSHAQKTARSYKQEIMEQLAPQTGATILDVGCGTGQDTQDFAQVSGAVSEEELTRFWNALEQADKEQHFFARVGGFVISGRKPL